MKIGPLRRTKSFVLRSKIEVPVTSEGSRSGVNWTRWYWQPSSRAKTFESVVLATPGTPSSRTCPPAKQGDEQLLGDGLDADDDAGDLGRDLLVELLGLNGEFVCGPRVGTGRGRRTGTRGRGHTHATLQAVESAETKRHLPSAWACRRRSKNGSSSRQRPTVSACGGP